MVEAIVPITDAELRPYGYRPGNAVRKCVTCRHDYKLHSAAWKCRECATRDFHMTERDCNINGLDKRPERQAFRRW